MKTNGQMSAADFQEALNENRLMFVTNFFISLGLDKADELANRFKEEEHKTFVEFLNEPFKDRPNGDVEPPS